MLPMLGVISRHDDSGWRFVVEASDAAGSRKKQKDRVAVIAGRLKYTMALFTIIR
jgi:hypothetical protein